MVTGFSSHHLSVGQLFSIDLWHIYRVGEAIIKELQSKLWLVIVNRLSRSVGNRLIWGNRLICMLHVAATRPQR